MEDRIRELMGDAYRAAEARRWAMEELAAAMAARIAAQKQAAAVARWSDAGRSDYVLDKTKTPAEKKQEARNEAVAIRVAQAAQVACRAGRDTPKAETNAEKTSVQPKRSRSHPSGPLPVLRLPQRGPCRRSLACIRQPWQSQLPPYPASSTRRSCCGRWWLACPCRPPWPWQPQSLPAGAHG
jgi:hypothetical protein